jgi:hypothetical protein
MAGLADLLTVEEAARVIRVGRTKAYAMAREWRATGGRSGLPVIDFGNVLRVPLCQLEAMVGGPLTDGVSAAASTMTSVGPEIDGALAADAGRPEQPPAPGPAPAPAVSDITAVSDCAPRSSRRPSRRRTRTPNQPTLPFLS